MKRLHKMLVVFALCMVFSLSVVFIGANFAVQKVYAEQIFSFTDAFNYETYTSKSLFSDDGLWEAENPSSDSGYSHIAKTPEVAGGVMKIVEGSAAQFNWLELPNFSFSTNQTYTMAFDVTVTKFGNGSPAFKNWYRELYLGVGGYYNQVELSSHQSTVTTNKCMRAGDSWAGNINQEYKENVPYNITLVWEPSLNKITTTIKNGNNVVVEGYRTNNIYKQIEKYTHAWVMRCEDGEIEIDNFSFSDGTNKYEENFSGTGMTGEGYWETEKVGFKASAPTVGNGILKLKSGEGVQFNWTRLASYDVNNSYTFEFDAKVTNEGTGYLQNDNANYTRVLYVAPGGWYNQVAIRSKDDTLIMGETATPYNSATFLNKTVHVKMTMEGKTITSAIYDENGTKIASGSRTKDEFTDINGKYMSTVALRCEDGAVEIDNFKFTVEKVSAVNTITLDLDESKYAEHSFSIDNTLSSKTSVKINNAEILYLGDELRMCGAVVTGSYGEGKYNVKITVNPVNKMAQVELKLPSGGIIRRGFYSFIGEATEFVLETFATDESKVTGFETTYKNAQLNEYVLNETEPTNTGSKTNIYNVITSFSDGATTRSFAFTTSKTFSTNATIVLNYRKVGESAWKEISTTKDTTYFITDEEYFKADLENLAPSTSYEYKIGKKNSDVTTDWTQVYTFTTASGEEDEFTFLAVGDTQGITWNGRTSSTKGFMFAQTAYEEAFEEYENPAFLLHAGDVVENGGNQNQWNMFFKSLGDKGASTPHFAAIGNHDTINVGTETNPNFYFNLHFNHPNNGGTKILDGNQTSNITNNHLSAMARDLGETVYSYNYGDAHFVVINSGNYTAQDQYLLEAQRKWLDADLKANACAKWKVVMFHEPVYHRLGGKEDRPWLYDVIESNGVDLVIQGHSHLVTRTYPMKNGQIVTKTNPDVIKQGTGTIYTTIGSTAYNHDGVGNPNVEECMMIATTHPEQPSYTAVTINGDKLIMTVKQIDGYVVDSFEITADKDRDEHVGTLITVGAKGNDCEEDGYTGDLVCSSCGEIIQKGEVIPQKGHKFIKLVINDKYKASDATCKEKATYYYSCECGEKGDKTFKIEGLLDHEFNKEVVDDKYLVSSATCISKAVYYHSCVCGDKGATTFEYGEFALHTYEDEYTCHDRTCTECKTYTEKATTDHKWNDGEVTTKPTCKEEGEKTFTCECGATKTESVDLVDHVYVKHDAQNKTCTTSGNIEYYTCENCEKLFVLSNETYTEVAASDIIIPASHNLVDVVAKDKTCSEAGYTAHKDCTECDYTEGKEIIPAGHELEDREGKDNTCTEDGYTAHKGCKNCDYVEGKSVIEAGHGYVSVAEIPATTEAEGTKAHHKCDNCNKKFQIVDGEYVEVTYAQLVIEKLPAQEDPEDPVEPEQPTEPEDPTEPSEPTTSTTSTGCGAAATDVLAIVTMLCALVIVRKKFN